MVLDSLDDIHCLQEPPLDDREFLQAVLEDGQLHALLEVGFDSQCLLPPFFMVRWLCNLVDTVLDVVLTNFLCKNEQFRNYGIIVNRQGANYPPILRDPLKTCKGYQIKCLQFGPYIFTPFITPNIKIFLKVLF